MGHQHAAASPLPLSIFLTMHTAHTPSAFPTVRGTGCEVPAMYGWQHASRQDMVVVVV
jgi:hypothetical protein